MNISNISLNFGKFKDIHSLRKYILSKYNEKSGLQSAMANSLFIHHNSNGYELDIDKHEHISDILGKELPKNNDGLINNLKIIATFFASKKNYFNKY